MAKKKATETPATEVVDKAEPHSNAGALAPSAEPQPGVKREPIDINKVYTLAQFAATLGMDQRTVQNYVDAGLAVRKVKGTKAVFVRGHDWFTFLGDQKHLAKDIDELSEEPSPLGQLADLTFKLENRVDKVEVSMEDVANAEDYRDYVHGLMDTADSTENRLAILEEDFKEFRRIVKPAIAKPKKSPKNN